MPALLSSESPLHVERAAHAANLYNSVHAQLTEAGWAEELGEPDPFHKGGVPTGSWRHPAHPGSFSMDAAYSRHVLDRQPRREDRGHRLEPARSHKRDVRALRCADCGRRVEVPARTRAPRADLVARALEGTPECPGPVRPQARP